MTSTRSTQFRLAAVAAAVALSSCSTDSKPVAGEQPPKGSATSPSEPAPKAPPKSGVRWYRLMVIDQNFLIVPFFMAVDPARKVVVFDNGEEKLEQPATITNTTVDVEFPIHGARLHLDLDVDGVKATGKWRNALSRTMALDLEIEGRLVPEHGQHILFPGDTADKRVDFSGSWKVDLGEFGSGVLMIRQSADGLIGGNLVAEGIGDSTPMTGRIMGRQFKMSQFDGTHGLVLTGLMHDDDKMFRGEFVVAGLKVYQVHAARSESASASAFLVGSLKQSTARVQIPELDARKDLDGKPVIVNIFGTWCSACRGLTPTLVELHGRYRAQGLNVLGVAVEPNDVPEAARKRVDALVAHYGIPWPVDIRLVEDVTLALPPEVNANGGFPVTLFLRGDRSVAGILSSFVSKSAGAEHAKMLEQLDGWTRDILKVGQPAPMRK